MTTEAQEYAHRAQQLADALFQQIERIAPEQTAYLVVNQAAIPDIQQQESLFLAHEAHSLLTLERAEADGISPMLLRIRPDPAGHNLLKALTRNGLYGNALHLIASSLRYTELLEALEARTHLLDAEGDDVVLRWFDGRVLDALQAVFTPLQWQTLMAPSAQWFSANREGGLSARHSLIAATRQAQLVLPFVLDAGQHAALETLTEADAVIAILHKRGSPQLADLLPPEQHRLIKAALSEARQHGLCPTSQRIAWCLATLEWGSGFAQHGDWPVKLAQIKSGSMSLQQALDGATT